MGAVKGSINMSFIYNDNGIRTSKTVNGVKHTYQLNGSQIVAEQWSDKLIVYLYDASGAPIGMMYRTTSYAGGSFSHVFSLIGSGTYRATITLTVTGTNGTTDTVTETITSKY